MVKKIQKHIEIVRSTTPGLSSMSSDSCYALYKLLKLHYSTVGISLVSTLEDLERLVSKKPDLVFVGMKFIPFGSPFDSSKKTWIAEYLDDHGIAYTGSGPKSHELEQDKALAKQRVADCNLKTSPFCVIDRNSLPSWNITLKYPVFIKPTNKGGGLGIDSNSLAYTREQAEEKINSLDKSLACDSLVEEYLGGREFSVAILKDAFADEFLTMPLELIAPLDARGERILSASVKSSDTETFIAVADPVLKGQICELALDAFHALGARDFGRIDIRLDDSGIPHFLEANLIPSLIEGYGNFPKACWLNNGIDYEHMMLQIVQLGFRRSLADAEDEEESIHGFVPIPAAI